MIAGEALIKLLEDYGVDTVFGIPGVHTLDIYRGLPGSNIKHVSVRHEQGAGFAADGYARATGKPGVCLIISGPGVTNITTPLGQAWADSIPMLVISSDNPLETQGKGFGLLHEVTDLAAVTAPLTAFSATAATVAEIPELIGKAYESFATQRPRPVHIVIPTDLLAETVTDEWEAIVVSERPAPAAELVMQASNLLMGAERPLILLGGGALGCGKAVTALAEWLPAQVISTNNGKGIVPDSHPLNAGGVVSRPAGHDAVAAADVILAIGTEMADTDSYTERYGINGKIIRVDLDSAQFDRMYATEIGIVADGAKTAEAILVDIISRSQKEDFENMAEEVAETKQRAKSELTPKELIHQKVLAAIQAALPIGGIGVADMCGLGYTATALWQAGAERQWHYPGGFCTLGPSMPMGIGAKLGLPNSAVVVMVGDAGFQFTSPELATAYEQKLPLPIVIWNNEGLGAIEEHMNDAGVPLSAVDYAAGNPDFVALAQAYHCYGVRPQSLDELTQAIEMALQADRPTIIDVWENVDW
ncbi:MAG: 5-guanidino-2-oxopentanoate decarboxylase [Cellvibrionaceae bacterium]|jgi:5-guanidino-2-oxopentanoate decarboxylase